MVLAFRRAGEAQGRTELTLSSFLPVVILASASPARKKILEDEGIRVIVRPTETDEERPTRGGNEVVEDLALRKLSWYLKGDPKPLFPVLCCDTLVSLDGVLIGKAKDEEEARAQLRSFSGKRQEVDTGWALYRDGTVLNGADTASVWFKELDGKAIETYLKSGEWKGAAGSYRIQEGGKELVDHVSGDIFTVVGLPLSQISAILSDDCVHWDAEFPPHRGE